MKNYFIILSVLFLSTIGFSQNNNQIYDFFGGKTFGNRTVFYRLLFQINNGKVSGYAFTDEQGNEETKSIIDGSFNPKNNTIIFSETNKLITKSRQGFKNSCYLNGVITLKINKKVSSIKGTFTELTASGKKCFNGVISIISLDSYSRLKKKIAQEKLIAKKIKKENSPKTNKTVLPSFNSNEKLTIKDNEEISIFWNSNTFILDIWDDVKEDGDEITIEFNDEIILEKYVLKNKKEQIKLPLKQGKNKLVFTANNTGLIANNTARVDLFDTKIKHQIITQLQLNKSVIVYLIR